MAASSTTRPHDTTLACQGLAGCASPLCFRARRWLHDIDEPPSLPGRRGGTPQWLARPRPPPWPSNPVKCSPIRGPHAAHSQISPLYRLVSEVLAAACGALVDCTCVLFRSCAHIPPVHMHTHHPHAATPQSIIFVAPPPTHPRLSESIHTHTAHTYIVACACSG